MAQSKTTPAQLRETVIAAFRGHKKMVLTGLRDLTKANPVELEKICSALVDEGVLKRGTITLKSPEGWEFPVTQYKLISKDTAVQSSLFPDDPQPPADQDNQGAKIFISE